MQTVNSEVVFARVDDRVFDEAQVAAVAFLARYNGRTLDAYRQDLNGFFDWAGIVGLEVLAAARGHIELYRQHMEQRGLAASTIDSRLSTVCGFYRFAHIDGRITANPAQYVRRPKVHPSEGRGLDRNELGRFLFSAERVDRAHAAGDYAGVLVGCNPPEPTISRHSRVVRCREPSADGHDVSPLLDGQVSARRRDAGAISTST